MTQEQITEELNKINRAFTEYLANTPHEIKHQVSSNGKTNIMNVYNHVIKTTQELYAIQRELLPK